MELKISAKIISDMVLNIGLSKFRFSEIVRNLFWIPCVTHTDQFIFVSVLFITVVVLSVIHCICLTYIFSHIVIIVLLTWRSLTLFIAYLYLSVNFYEPELHRKLRGGSLTLEARDASGVDINGDYPPGVFLRGLKFSDRGS